MAKFVNPWFTHLSNVRKTVSPGTSIIKIAQIAKKTYKRGMKALVPAKKTNKKQHKKYGRRRSNKMRGGEGDTNIPQLPLNK